ncbi:MAG: hypothetical protein H6636_13845, partial [Anaerolineales bacterium]|nr:hypothetical protein [Anaerolineales bacterium]
MLPPLLPSSLLSSDDLVMEQAAAESALPDVVDVIHCEYVFSNALGYFLVPELKYEDLPARVRPAGFPFVLGSQTPVLTSY